MIHLSKLNEANSQVRIISQNRADSEFITPEILNSFYGLIKLHKQKNSKAIHVWSHPWPIRLLNEDTVSKMQYKLHCRVFSRVCGYPMLDTLR